MTECIYCHQRLNHWLHPMWLHPLLITHSITKRHIHPRRARLLLLLLQLIGFFAAAAGGNRHSTLDRFIARWLLKLMLAAFCWRGLLLSASFCSVVPLYIWPIIIGLQLKAWRFSRELNYLQIRCKYRLLN